MSACQSTALKNHQHNTIRSNRKLQFYSIFKTDKSSCLQLEHHRQSVDLVIMTLKRLKLADIVFRKSLKKLIICPYCSSSKVENEILFVFHCHSHKQIRETFFNDITLKYPEFNTLSEQNKRLFLVNNIDLFICKKKRGYFVFDAFQKS